MAVLAWWVWRTQVDPIQPTAVKLKGTSMSIELGLGESKQVTPVPVDAAGRDTVLPVSVGHRFWRLVGDVGQTLLLELGDGASVKITGGKPGSSALHVEQAVDGVVIIHEEDVVVKASPVAGFRFDVQPVLSPAELLGKK